MAARDEAEEDGRASLPALREPDGGPALPGTVLRLHFIEPAGISESALADHARLRLDSLSRLMHGQRGMDADYALRIAAATNTQAEWWMALQSRRALWEAERAHPLTIPPMAVFRGDALPPASSAAGTGQGAGLPEPGR